MPTPWDAFPPVGPVDPKKTGNPWDAFPPADAPMDDSASWQPPEEAYQPAPVEQFGPPAPVGRPNVEQFGPPDLPQYQPTESLQVRDPRSLGEIVGFDTAKAQQVERDSQRQIIEAAISDFQNKTYRNVTRGPGGPSYDGIPQKYAALYERAFNDVTDRTNVADRLSETERTEYEAVKNTVRNMGTFGGQLAATGERLPTELASIPLRAAGQGAGVEEFARRSAMTSRAADEIAAEDGGLSRVGNTLGKAVGTVASMFLNRVPGKYGVEAGGGLSTGLATYNENRARGVDQSTAIANATVNGLLEAGVASAFQKFGLGGVEDLVGRGVQKGLANAGLNAVAELSEEEITTLTQGLSTRLVELASGRDDLGGFKTKQDVLNAVAETAEQTVATVGVAQGARKAGQAIQSPQEFKDAIAKASRQTLDFLAGKESLSRSDAQKLGLERTSAEERAQLKAVVDARIAELDKIQPELKDADPSQRQGQKYAEPLPEVPRGEGMSEDAFAREIQQSDSAARRYMPTQRSEDPELAGLSTVDMDQRQRPPNRDQRRAELEAGMQGEPLGDPMRSAVRPAPKDNLFNEPPEYFRGEPPIPGMQGRAETPPPYQTQTGELPLDKATERFDKMVASVMGQAEMNRAQVARQFSISKEDAKEVLYEAAIRKEMRKGASRNAAIRRVRNASDPEALPREEAVLELAQSTENERQRKLAEQRYRLEQAKPPLEVPTPLTKEEALAEFVAKNERGGIDRRNPSNEIDKALAELDNEQDQGYEPDQREISVESGKKYGALLDDFESEQLDRIEKRRAGDKKQVIVNPHPVTGLIEGKWANQRLAEMSVQRALAQNKPVTYVEGDFHNLGGLNAKFGQTGADRHLKNVTTLFKRFLPENSDVALVHKGGDEYGFHFIGMTADEVRAALDKSKPFIEAYSKKHDLGMVPHTKEGKSGGVGVNYSVVQFDPKKHKADVYTDTQGKPLRLNQAGALIYEADRALEAEKKKHGKVKGQAARADGGRGEGQRVSQPSVGEAPISRPAGRQGSVDQVSDAQGKQPSGSGEAVSDEASQKRRAAIEKRFPGAKVTPTKKGYKIDIRGKELTVEYGVPKASRAQAARELGRKLSDLEWSKIQDKARGQFQSKQGTAGRVVLREDHGDKTADHEVFHVKKQFLTDKEWKALKKQYGKGAGDKQAEEYIAQAREKWDGSIKGEGDKVFAAMDQESFFDRIGPKTSDPIGDVYGRPDLANQGKGEQRDFVDDVDEKNKANQEVRSREVARKQAQEEYDKDPKKAQERILNNDFNPGNEKDANLGFIVANKLFEEAQKANTPENWEKAVKAQLNSRSGGTEVARAFAARQDLEMSPQQRILHMLGAPDRKHERMIKNAKTEEERQAAIKKWSKRIGEIKNRLGYAGIDIDNYSKMTREERAMAENELSASKSSWVSMLREIGRNNFLTAPVSVVRNITANLAHGAKRILVDRLVEAHINTLRQYGKDGHKMDGATLGELRDVLRNVYPNIMTALSDAKLAFRIEQSDFDKRIDAVLNPQKDQDKASADKVAEGKGPAIPAKYGGRIFRLGDRLNRWGDEFATSLFSRMEAAAQASRIARQEGLKDQAFAARVKDLLDDPESKAWENALKEAAVITFRGSNKLVDKVVNLRDNTFSEPTSFMLWTLMPFVKTPANIYKEGLLQATPLGAMRVAHQMVQNYRNGDQILGNNASKHLAQQMLMMAAYAIMYGAMKDDEDSFTGSAEFGYDPSHPGKGQFLSGEKQANSIKFGKSLASYNNFEPMATGLSLFADWMKARLKGNSGTVAAFKNIINSAEEKTFVKTIADLAEVGTKRDAESIRRLATNWLTGWTIPNALKNPSKNLRENKDELRAWGKGQMYLDMAWKRLGQATETPFITPDYFPRRNIWGEELKKSQPTGVQSTDALFRMLSPTQIKTLDYNKGDRIILNWNNQQDKEWYPAVPRPDYKVRGETRYMTEEQYDRYLKETGEAIKKKVENWKADDSKPTEQNIKWLKRQMKDERDRWRKRNLQMTAPVADDDVHDEK